MLIFLSGWPACGQTYYGEWLAEHHGFMHLDLDASASAATEWHDKWERLLPDQAPALARHLRERNPNWVITGENPPDHLRVLGALQAADFQLWFLLPRSETLCRQTWINRERELGMDVEVREWERRAANIRKNARALRPFFRDRCLTTLKDVGRWTDGAEFAVLTGVVPKNGRAEDGSG